MGTAVYPFSWFHGAHQAARHQLISLAAPHNVTAQETAAPKEEPEQIADRIQPAPVQCFAISKGLPADHYALRDAVDNRPKNECQTQPPAAFYSGTHQAEHAEWHRVGEPG